MYNRIKKIDGILYLLWLLRRNIISNCKLSRLIRNFIERKRYGSCPNCDKSWFWIGENFDTVIYFENITKCFSIPICNNCLNHPEKLKPEKVYQNLIKNEWNPTDAKLASDIIKSRIPIKYMRNKKLTKILKNEIRRHRINN